MGLPLELQFQVCRLATAQLLTQLHQELKIKVELTDFKKNNGHGHLVSTQLGWWHRNIYFQSYGDLMWGVGTNPHFVYASDLSWNLDLARVERAGHDHRQALTCMYNNAVLFQHFGRLRYMHVAECRE